MSEVPPVTVKRRAATRRIFLKLCGSTLAACAAAPLQARCYEPYAIDVTRHEVPLPDLPPELDGITLAHLTDVHRGPVTPDATIKQAVAAAAALNPDLVVITGDFVHGHHRDAAPLAEMLAPLKPRLGLWGCLGNHDYSSIAHRVVDDLKEGAGLRMLRNESAALAPGLWIAGIEDTLRGKPDMQAARRGIPKGEAAIMLTHNPIGVFACDEHPYLVLAGHTHGGQIRIPGLPPRYPPGMAGFPYVSGWGVFDQARLYISRGVGMGVMPLRFRCRPEVAFMTLRRGDGVPTSAPGLAVRAFHRVGRTVRRLARK